MHLLQLKETKHTQERIEQQRKEQVDERMRMRAESLQNSHFLIGTENDAYYTCKFCYNQIKNTYTKYVNHHAVCFDKKKMKNVT